MSKRISIPFLGESSEVPFVWFSLANGVAGCALVDTGSESTIFDLNFVRAFKDQFKINKTKNKINFVGISKGSEQPIVNVNCKVYLSGKNEFSAEGILSDLSYVKAHLHSNFDIELSAIFGSDFLNSIGAKINFKKRKLEISDDISGQQ